MALVAASAGVLGVLWWVEPGKQAIEQQEGTLMAANILDGSRAISGDAKLGLSGYCVSGVGACTRAHKTELALRCTGTPGGGSPETHLAVLRNRA